MFHLVSATSMALTLFLFSHRLRAEGKWRILSVQTPMLQKAFNSTNWTHTQQSCQAKLLSHVKDQWGGRKAQTPLLSVYANRRGKRAKKQGHWAELKLCCDANKGRLRLGEYHLNLIRCFNLTMTHWEGRCTRYSMRLTPSCSKRYRATKFLVTMRVVISSCHGGLFHIISLS